MIRINVGAAGVAGLAAGLLLAGGCASKSQPVIKSEPVSADGVVVNPPIVSYDNGLLYVRGSVHAEQASNYDIPGKIDVEIVGPTGTVDSRWHTNLLQKDVPADPAHVATYELLFDAHPTRDEVVRVRFVDPATAEKEKAEDKAKSING